MYQINQIPLIHIPYPQKPVFKNKADKDLKVVYNKDAIIEFELNNAENPTYAWEYSADNSANSWSIIEGATLHSYAVGELDAQEGWYRLVASNHKNNETKTTTSEKSFIVTKPVQPVSVTAFKTSAKTYEIESTIVIDESGKIKIKPQLGANLNGSGKSAL